MIVKRVIDGRKAILAFLTADWKPVSEKNAEIVKIIYDDGKVEFLGPNGLGNAHKSSSHPDLHVKPENAQPIQGLAVADVVTRANVQHVSWEMVREGKFDPNPTRLPLADLIATQQVVDRQRVDKHMQDLLDDNGQVEPKSPPLVLLWDGDYFLLGPHHGTQAAYNLGIKVIGVMLAVAPE